MQGYTISQAAKKLCVSARTIRRFIKAGKLQADMVTGPFGPEYRILELPDELHTRKPADDSPSQTSIQAHVQFADMIRELQEKNLTLAAQLGAASERIRQLEKEIKLLIAPGQKPWWQRWFRK